MVTDGSLTARWLVVLFLQTVLCTCCCGEEHGFSQELYTGVIQEGDPAGTKIADVQYNGSGSVHLTGIGSGDFELQANGTVVTRGVVRGDQAGDIVLSVVATRIVGFEVLVTTAFVLVKVKATENVCIRQVFGRCSQICVEMPATDTGYMCDCAEGYTLQRNGYICQANDPEPLVVLSSESGIFSFNTRLRAFHSVASGNSTVSALAYDTPNRALFVAHGNRISSISMDGTALQSLYSDTSLPSDDIQGMDWDWTSGRLYFSSASQGAVFVLPLDTSEPTPQVLLSGRVSPRGVTLNVVTREIFWIEGPTSSSRIITAKLDTGEGVALSSGPTSIVSNLNGTEGLAVDSVQQRVWWTTADGLIESAGFDGTQREVLHSQSSPLTSIDVFEDFVYAVAPSLNSLLKVNKFARREVFFEDEPVYTTFPPDLQGALIRVMHPLQQPNASQDVDECRESNGGCEQRCVNFIGSYSCTCYHGYSLNADGHSCDLAGGCAAGVVGCTHSCVGDSCVCRQGYQLAADNRTCTDINECTEDSDRCSHYCINEEGGYRCTCPTKLFLAMDGLTCEGCSEGNGGCSHVCTTTPHGHSCYCRSGFRLGQDGMTCYAEEVSELVFSARRQEDSALGHTVFTADLSGRAFSRLVDVNTDEDPPTGPIYGMEYDLQTGVLVYADRSDKSLWRVPLQRIIFATDLREKIADNVTAWGLAFNYMTRELYWTDDSAGMICRSSLDIFTGCQPVVMGLDQPRGIALDPLGKLYWSEAGSNVTRIASTVLGGVGGVTTVVSGPAHLTDPGGITIDYVTQRIYWADTGSGAIGVVGLDGSGPGRLVSALPNSPFQVAVDGDFVFWSNFDSINYNFVDRMDPGRVHTSQLQEPLSRSFTLFGMVVVNSNRRPDPGYQTCLDVTVGCSHFCNVTGGSSSCSCPQGFTLAEDARRCVQNACGVDNGGCSQICVTSNTSSDAYCACEGGYILDSDGKQCIGICSIDPCPDGTVCVPQPDGPPLCACPPGSTIPNCTIVDPCALDPCQNGANCTVVDVVDFECVCPAGATGENCTQDCPEGTFGVNCSEECECANGADCSPIDGSCSCQAGFTGTLCQSVCPNGTFGSGCNMTCAPCVNGDCDPVTGECVCDSGYSGDPCEPVCSQGCQNGGTCTAPEQCSCRPTFTGPACNESICSIDPCPDGTVCVPQPDGPPLCACPPGSTIPNCTIVDPCAMDPCQNGANCTVVDVVDFECVCPAGATGENCTQDCPEGTFGVNCSEVCECANGADCSPIDGSCSCQAGFTGTLCQSVCPNGTFGSGCNMTCAPCVNGDCDPVTGECVCDSGYSGDPCEPVCSQGCQNGGTCTAPEQCSCRPTFTGPACNESICSIDPCPEGTVCVPQPDGPPLCACPPGSTIPNCTIVDPCAMDPCQNGANCTVVDVVDYECVCPAGATGENCTQDCPEGTFGVNCSEVCECANGADCSPIDGSCSCQAGFTGTLCQSVCPNGTFGSGCNMTCAPCVNGDCDPVTGECVCDSGYSGDPCEPVCSQGCQNGGTCTAPEQCSCRPTFTGPACNESICSIEPCPDGTVCVPQPDGPPLCACPPGSTIPNCTIVDPCAMDPCQNGANCTVVDVVDFECVCPAGATGENCTQDCPEGTFGVNCSEECECANGADCSPIDGSCSCQAGFTGTLCQSVCPNGTFGSGCNMTCAPCVNGDCDPVTGECVCDSGYSGDPCEPVCSQGCQNGGTCTAPEQCSCRPTFTGPACNESICSIDPCPEGTVCVPQPDGPPLCACPPGSTIPNCTIVDPCAMDPCQNGANCTVVDVVDFECVCPAGATGENCTQDCPEGTFGVNCSEVCECVNGADCSPIDGSCSCRAGFTGTLCQSVCPNGTFGSGCNMTCAPCVNGDCDPVTGECVCDSGYSGDPCEPVCSQGCQNGGTCTAPEQCSCRPTFTGPICDERECLDGFCLNDGTCDVSSGTLACLCLEGFRGRRCEDVIETGSNPVQSLESGATAGVTVGAVITVGVVGAAVAALVVFLVARQRRRSSKSTTQVETNSFENDTYGWAEPKASSGGEVVKNMATMESGEAESGYAIVSPPPPSLKHVEEGPASEHHGNGEEPQNEDITGFANYESLRHISL